ncbi:MAG: malic enzyme-like NAD(P)-binding protein [Burkholderiaceae bacterium]
MQAGLEGRALQQACAVLDSRGLLIDGRAVRDAYKKELAWEPATADEFGLGGGADHGLAVVAHYKPITVLIGASGQAGAFTEHRARDGQPCRATDHPAVFQPHQHLRGETGQPLTNGPTGVAWWLPAAPLTM